MVPDRNIVKKVKCYDSNLFIKWNPEYQFFELWMKHWQGGAVKITPITQSIYDNRYPRRYVELDNRLLMWIYHADSSRPSDMDYIQTFKGFKDFEKKQAKSRREDSMYSAKQVWHGANNFFSTKYNSKNSKPKFTNNNVRTRFIIPDSKSKNNPRTYQRTKINALAYNYGG